MRNDRKLTIVPAEPDEHGECFRLIVYERYGEDAFCVLDVIEGPFAFIMQTSILQFDKSSDLRVHRRKWFRRDK